MTNSGAHRVERAIRRVFVEERERLDKEIVKIEGELRTVEDKLKNKSFVDRAPAAVVEEHRKRKTDFTEQLSQLRQARAAMD